MKTIVRRFLPAFLISWYHFILAFASACWYRFPSRRLIVVGVTGTNGKSTVVEMCHHIFQEAGFKVASISSIRFKIEDDVRPNMLKMTMPGRFILQKFLREAADYGCAYAILEVTSEGIKQHRHRFIDFDIAVITNLTPEHIEAHGGFEKYREAKGMLFKRLKSQTTNYKLQTNSKAQITRRKLKSVAVVNLDDENAEYFLQFPADEKFGYTISESRISSSSPTAVIKAENIQILPAGTKFHVRNLDIYLPLLGEFNVSNALAAICVGLSQGIDLGTIKKALEKIGGVSGRMEVVVREPFTVIVDYAHTPDALRKVYDTLLISNLKSQNSKLICVLGAAGGGRDKWKRPEMGRIAAQYCDKIILTNEDPYDEDPNQILSDIKSGILNSQFPTSNMHEILDRREAIRFALRLAYEGDVIIITGKGSEPWMCIAGGKKVPWDDREIVKEEMKRGI